MKNNLYLFFKVKDSEKQKLEEFFKVNEYIAGNYDKPDGFAKLNKAIEEKGSCNRIFYLALPPSVYETVTLNLKAVCMSKGWVIYLV